MIYTERKVSIKNDTATIDSPIILFRGDREVEIMFTIVDSKFKFESNKGNVIDKTQAAFGQLAVALPDGTDLFTEIVECENGVVVFSITGEMIDEIHEVGFYSFHIRLYNDDKSSRITLPPVMEGIEIREPLIIEGDVENTDLVGDATAGYSMVQTIGTDEEVFDEDGNYIPTVWGIGDKITAEKLNKMEEGLANAKQGQDDNELTLDKLIQEVEVKHAPVDITSTITMSDAGYYADITNGEVVSTEQTTNYKNTGFIDCYPESRYGVSYSISKSVVFYDKDKQFISSMTITTSMEQYETYGILITTPKNAEYMIYNCSAEYAYAFKIYDIDYHGAITYTFPALDLNEKCVMTINNMKPENNNINIDCNTIGAAPLNERHISSAPNTVIEYTTSNKAKVVLGDGASYVNVKSINVANIHNDSNTASQNTECVIENDAQKITLTFNGTADTSSWARTYTEFTVNNLKPGVEYTLYCECKMTSKQEDTDYAKGIVVYTSAVTNVTLSNNLNAWYKQATFTCPEDGIVKLRLYPSNLNISATGSPVVCVFNDLMLYESSMSDSVSGFISYHRTEYNVEGLEEILVDIKPYSVIECDASQCEVYELVTPGTVKSVDNVTPDDNGNVTLNVPNFGLKNANVIFFGDSITEFGRYDLYVRDMIGVNTYNAGVGGTRMSYHADDNYDAFSMTKIADAIVSGDFSLQQTACQSLISDYKDDNTEAFNAMSTVDYNDIDYMVIGFATNDFGGGISIGDKDSQADNQTYRGAIKYVIEKICTKYPHIQLLFVGPIYRWKVPADETVYDSDINGINDNMLVDFANALADECVLHHIPCIQMYDDCSINKFNYATYISEDGTHPTEAGYRLIARKVAKQLAYRI